MSRATLSAELTNNSWTPESSSAKDARVDQSAGPVAVAVVRSDLLARVPRANRARSNSCFRAAQVNRRSIALFIPRLLTRTELLTGNRGLFAERDDLISNRISFRQ